MVTTHAAVIGVGQMGWHIARHLARGGLAVTAFDPRVTVRDRLGEIGVRPVESAAEAARVADIVILMVLNIDQAEQAIWGDGGVGDGISDDSLLVVMSSLSPRYVRELGERAVGHFRLVDAPVSGGVEGASAAALTIMAAGAAEDIDRFRPVAALLGEVTRVGDRPGLGATMKTVNQAMLFAGLAVAAEMTVAAAKAGLDPAQVVDVIGRSSGANWALAHRVPLAWTADYQSGATLAIAAKDLAAARELAEELGMDVGVVEATVRLVDRAMARHGGEGDDPIVVEQVEFEAGFRLAKWIEP